MYVSHTKNIVDDRNIHLRKECYFSVEKQFEVYDDSVLHAGIFKMNEFIYNGKSIFQK